MKKITDGSKIIFLNENDEEIMYMDFFYDEFIWYFYNSNKIVISSDSELYPLLEKIMQQDYIFHDNNFNDYKDKIRLIWYSDCYCNPDDEFSMNMVSILNIELVNNEFIIWCEKPIDKMLDKKDKTYSIIFSPSGNGKSNKNIKSGLTLQDDIVMILYQNLIKNNSISKKRKK